MPITRMDHVGIVVDDLKAVTEFFVALGLELQGEAQVGGAFADRVIGLEGVRSDIAYLQTPDNQVAIELSKFHSPPVQGETNLPSNTRGIRHLSFLVDDVDAAVARLQARGVELVGDVMRFEDAYRVCYVRGPEGILVELAESLN